MSGGPVDQGGGAARPRPGAAMASRGGRAGEARNSICMAAVATGAEREAAAAKAHGASAPEPSEGDFSCRSVSTIAPVAKSIAASWPEQSVTEMRSPVVAEVSM